MEKLKFKFVIKKKKSRHLIAKNQWEREGINKGIEIITLKMYSLSEQVRDKPDWLQFIQVSGN